MTTLQDLSEERQLNILRSIVLCDVGKKERLREENERLLKKVAFYEKKEYRGYKWYTCTECSSPDTVSMSIIRHGCPGNNCYNIIKSAYCKKCTFSTSQFKCPQCKLSDFEVIQSVDFE